MSNDKFSINEIIVIVMAIIEDMENELFYGIESEQLNIPDNINQKINYLDENECEKFFETIYDISKKIFKLKNGELNELNIIHNEIIKLSSIYLNEYMI